MWLEKIDSAKHAIAVKFIEARWKGNMLESMNGYDDYEDNNEFDEDNRKDITKAP